MTLIYVSNSLDVGEIIDIMELLVSLRLDQCNLRPSPDTTFHTWEPTRRT